ncbi:unnamed protein product [Rhizophagus irregularis]|uniref:Uncharacterized protein n=1 Tax=Rhizophagus irregularis TaxID=588596 RepID=A0A915ZKG1_9GLOM|nr:unnamed protein product [Rhizophagus irregularis]
MKYSVPYCNHQLTNISHYILFIDLCLHYNPYLSIVSSHLVDSFQRIGKLKFLWKETETGNLINCTRQF